METYLQPHHCILEINAGSGIDAVYFAQKGHHVVATDIASESEKHIKYKTEILNLSNLHFQKCSFTALNEIRDQKFNHIFSNFGGLNCTDDLQSVFSQFNRLLLPDGFVSLVIMPKYYPWEMATFIKGNQNAFRRFDKNGTLSTVEKQTFKTFYYSPKEVKKAMGNHFRHIKTKNIGTFYPSAHFVSLQKHKRLMAKLVQFDTWINNSQCMIKGVGDYFVITFQKTN